MADSDNILSPAVFSLLSPEEQKDRKELEKLQLEFSVENDTDDDKIVMDNPFNPKDIDIKTKTMSMDNIIKRLKENEIDLAPDFQRNMNLWDDEKQSCLIESLLIKFPLPAFYFDGSDDNKWLVVDGLQRLSAIKNFVVDQTLRLTGLEFLEKLNGHTFAELPRTFQRQIEEAEIISYVINPGTPEDVKFNIFKRINTGGLVLEPQEIRHALNQGIPARFVAELAQLEEFKRATGYVISSKRMLDREFVTRFISFYINDPNDYKPDLDTFMTKSMGQIKHLSEKERDEIKRNFSEAMKCVMAIFGKWAFRKVYDITEKRRPINKALFEVWSVMLARLNDSQRHAIINNKELVFERFIILMNMDNFFVSSITSSTGDKSRIKYRFSEIENLLKESL